MKKALALLVIVSSFLVIGCSGSEDTSGGGNLPAADPNATNATAAGKSAGKAVMTPMAAPPGVKTGTPGG